MAYPRGPHSLPYVHIPEHTRAVYVLELDDGQIKVGCSNSLQMRLTMYSRELSKQGRRIVRFDFSEGKRDDGETYYSQYRRERAALAELSKHAVLVPGTREYFTGIDFDTAAYVVNVAAQEA